MLLVYQAGLWQLHKRVESGYIAPNAPLFNVVLTTKQLAEYTARAGELHIGNRFYDIKHIQRHKGKWLLTLVNDAEEEDLVDDISRCDTSPNGSSLPNVFFEFLNMFFLLPQQFFLHYYNLLILISYPRTEPRLCIGNFCEHLHPPPFSSCL